MLVAMPEPLRARFSPWSYGAAVVMTTLTAAIIVGAGVWALVSHTQTLGLSVGIVLLIYGLIIAGVAWLAWARQPLAWGLLVAVSLLNACTAASFLQTESAGQWWLALSWLVFAIATGVFSMLPKTRVALQRSPQGN